MSVTQEIVHSVDIEVAVYDTGNEIIVLLAFHHCADIIGTYVKSAESFVEIAVVYVFGDLLMAVMKIFLHELLGGMRIGTVTDIMQKCGDLGKKNLLRLKRETLCHKPGKMHCT